MFKKAVLENGVSYDRFRDDFINSHTFHTVKNPAIRNDHQVNLGRIAALLMSREDLVRKYYSGESDRETFLSCMRELMLDGGGRVKAKSLNFECFFSDKVLVLLAQAANDIPLFRRPVTSQDMGRLFNECSANDDDPLIANKNTVLAYFFSQMNSYGLITANYQLVIATNRLIMGSRGREFLNQHDLSVALVRYGMKDRPAKMRIDRWVDLIRTARNTIKK
ncbi:MAG: hypothetical protein IKW89_04220 [Bacteroidales bacterium]|nr:hypothetical protein [Bacteroidales bacterium]